MPHVRWKIGEAKQRFSEVVRLAAEEPQVIQNRERVVAAVIAGDEIEDVLRWIAERRAPTLAATLVEMRDAAAHESWDLPVPARANRSMTAGSAPPQRREKRRAR